MEIAMKRFLAAAVTVASLAFASPSLAQTPPNVLVVGQIAEPKSLDPHAVTAVNDFRILMNVYDGLVRYKDGTLEVEPALAESWTISDDGTVYTFKLREGVTFHDGSPLQRRGGEVQLRPHADENHPFHDTGPFPLSFFFSAVDTSRRRRPDGRVQAEGALRAVPVEPRLSDRPDRVAEAVKQHGAEFGRNPSGTGAYKFAEWEANAKVVVTRNEDYWDGAPDLEAIIYRPITDANTRIAEMLSGGLDIMVEVPPDSLQQFRTDAQFVVHEQAGPHVWFLILNAKEGPFAKKEIRQAANYAINKTALVDNILQGTAEVAAGPTPPAFAWAYNESLEPYPYDPEKAKQLLADAGYDGEELTFYVTEGGSGMLDPIAMGTAIQADLEAVGMDVKIETYEWNTFLGKVNPGLEGKADMAEMAWMTNDPDTLPFLALRTEAWPDKGGFNSGYYSNPKVDELLEAARRATDQGERAKLYQEMQTIVQEDAPWVFVANWKQNAVTKASVENFKLQPSFFLMLQKVAKPQ
jgi:peptide/nickel transport system substrate-binding protein